MEPPDPSFADELNVPQEDAVLVFDVRRAAVSLPFQVHRFKVLVGAGLVAFSIACFELADEVPNKAQHGSLAHLPKVFPSHFRGLSKAAVVGFWAWVPPRLLSLLPCCVNLSFHTGPRALNPCSVWALRARYQIGRSGKYDIGHVGGDVTDADAIGDWW